MGWHFQENYFHREKATNAKSEVLTFTIKISRILHFTVSVSEKKSRREQIIPAGNIPCYISRQTL